MAQKGSQDLGLILCVPDNSRISKRHGGPDNINGQRVFSNFDPDLKDRVMEFIRKDGVATSMVDFLRLASEFYLASYQQSGGFVRGRFPTRSAGEELGVLQKARDRSDPRKDSCSRMQRDTQGKTTPDCAPVLRRQRAAVLFLRDQGEGPIIF